MATQWYCRLMGTELGPFTSKQLLEMARSHRLVPDDSVKKGADGMWVAAYRVKGPNSVPINWQYHWVAMGPPLRGANLKRIRRRRLFVILLQNLIEFG